MSPRLANRPVKKGVEFTQLYPPEIFWRDHQIWLQDCGYMLRPRFRPGWEPSWLNETNPRPLRYEDGQPLREDVIIDAVRISDGTYVGLKITRPSLHPYEVDIATFLSSEPLARDKQNHCVPIYEVLNVPDDDDKVILVMPLLRQWNSPEFETIGEAVDFFGQLFQGLQFMHKHHVAHRDISLLNVMMDGSLYPEGWHFCQPEQDRQHPYEPAKHYTRTQCPPKYYLTDFGISRRYDPKDGPPREPPIHGGDRTVPEFQKSIEPCNPFPTDIYYAGNLIRENILKKYRGFGFMRGLVRAMVRQKPAKRPTIDQVVRRFDRIQRKLGETRLRSRAGSRKEWFGPIRDLAEYISIMRVEEFEYSAIPHRTVSAT